MHWLAYQVEDDRVIWLRIIHADQRPQDVDVLNNGFLNEQEALGLMAHYLESNEAGFLTINPERASQHVTLLQRIGIAFAVEPFLLYGLLVAYGLIGLILLLFVFHLLAGG